MRFGSWKKACTLGLLLIGTIAVGRGASASDALWGDGVVIVPSNQPAPTPGVTPGQEQAFAAGQWESPQQMFEVVCQKCHDNATPTTPRLLGRGIPARFSVSAARNGRRGMPAFKPSDFTDEEMQRLAEWIELSASPNGGTP